MRLWIGSALVQIKAWRWLSKTMPGYCQLYSDEQTEGVFYFKYFRCVALRKIPIPRGIMVFSATQRNGSTFCTYSMVSMSCWYISNAAMPHRHITRDISHIRMSLWHKQRVLMHRHQGWNVRHGLCHIYMRYLYIYELFIAFVCFVVCSLL